MDFLDLLGGIDGLMTIEAGMVLPELAPQFNEAALAALNARCPQGSIVNASDLRAALLAADIDACVEALANE